MNTINLQLILFSSSILLLLAVDPQEVPQKIDKRLETIDGVEIASSYNEYIELARNDLKDRLNKSKLKLIDFNTRIDKRSKLLTAIKKEIERRKDVSVDLIEKEKNIRNRLIKNTAMKSAIQNLADIAGYNIKHKSLESNNQGNTYYKDHFNLKKFEGKALNNTYIEMANFEITEMLSSDKQMLVMLVRKKINNDAKLNELEKLRDHVKKSLIRLKVFVSRLDELIKHDEDVEEILKKLLNELKLDKNEKKNVLSIINYYSKIKSAKN